LAGVAALAFYLGTLNHWISFVNLAQVAKLSGYVWQAECFRRCITPFPRRCAGLPPRWVPLGVNVFSAVWRGVDPGLLARAVALLPHDRTNAQRRTGDERGCAVERSTGLAAAVAGGAGVRIATDVFGNTARTAPRTC